MELNPDLHFLLYQERRANAIREVERRRMIGSLGLGRKSHGWVERLALRVRALSADHLDEGIGLPRPRQSASSSTL